MGKQTECQTKDVKSFEIPTYTTTDLAQYLAHQRGERITEQRGDSFKVGNKAGSISVHYNSQNKAVATDFAGDGKEKDLFAWIAELEGIEAFKDQITRAYEILGKTAPVSPAKAAPEVAFKIPRQRAMIPKGLKDLFLQGKHSQEFANILEQRGIRGLDVDSLDGLGFVESNIAPFKAGKVGLLPRSLVVWNDTELKAIPLNAQGYRDKDTPERHVRQLGNIAPVFKPIDQDKPLYIVEGEFDALALISIGLQAIPCKPEGETNTAWLKGLKSPVLAYDNDTPGRGYTQKALALNAGAVDVSGIFDAGQDPNDFVKFNQNARFLIERANSKALEQLEQTRQDRQQLADLQSYLEQHKQKDGEFKVRLNVVAAALRVPAFCGFELAYDEFIGDYVYRKPGEQWVYIDEDTQMQIRSNLEDNGFAHIGAQMFRDAMVLVCSTKHINSWKENNQFPAWDGKSRIADFFEVYCHTVDNNREYERAVALNLFTSLYGRASCRDKQGIKSDYTTVLVGKQGIYKSRLVDTIAQGYSGTLDFSKNSDNLYRQMNGKTVMEIAELGNMSKRDCNEIKAFMTEQVNEWVPKYQERAKREARHCIFIVTTNDDEFLSDTTGNRRFAPVRLPDTPIDLEAIKKDMPQIMAESKALFEKQGIIWQDLARLVEDNNKDYQTHDAWFDTIRDYLIKERITTIRSATELARVVLGIEISKIDNRAKTRISNVLRQLGFSYKATRITEKMVNQSSLGEFEAGQICKCFTIPEPLKGNTESSESSKPTNNPFDNPFVTAQPLEVICDDLDKGVDDLQELLAIPY